MNSGKIFEKEWKNSIPPNIFYLRLKDSPSSFGKDSSFVRFTLSSPYDCIIFYNGFLFPLELKSTEGTSFSIQKDKSEKSKMIKLHQINGLSKSSKYDNICSGFILNFANSETYYISIKDFDIFLCENEKKSINEKDIIKYNGIKIQKQKKIKSYTYDICNLLTTIIKEVK